MKQKPSVIKEIIIDKEIKSVFYDEEYVGLIVASGQADNPYTMLVYDIEGTKVCDMDFNFSYKNIKIANKTIILYNDVTLKVYTVKGKTKYESNFDEGIVDVIMLEDRYNYLIVTPMSIDKIKLK
jgi:ribosomal protein S4E